MNIRKLLFVLSFCVSAISFAQVGVGTSTPNASAQLDVVATGTGAPTADSPADAAAGMEKQS